MKKLLSLLGTIGLSTSALSVLGLQYANKAQAAVVRKISNYIDVSSLLARATILSQHSNPASGGKGFSLEYASRYIDSRNIGDFFPSGASLQGVAKTTKARTLLGSMFDYPEKNGLYLPQLSESNLDLDSNPRAGKSGNSEVINTLGVFGGVLQILLGNDFNEGLASTIYGLLSGGAIDNIGASIKDSIPDIANNYLKNPATGEWIFNELADIWSEDDLIGSNGAYPGREFTSLTFEEVFKVRQDSFWMGISRILFSGYGPDWKSVDSKIKSASTSTEKAAIALPKDEKDFKVELNGVLLEGLFQLIRYFRTLGVYYERILSQAMPSQLITDSDHVFDQNIPNRVWLGQRINATADQAYAPKQSIVAHDATRVQAISLWSEEKVNGVNKYYQLINIQSLVQFFTKLLVVDPIKDPQSFTTQQALAILLGVPTLNANDKEKAANIDNPFGDVILGPLLEAIGDYFGQRVNIEALGQVIHVDGLGGFLRQVSGLLRVILSDSTAMWDTSPLTNDSELKIVLPVIRIYVAQGPYSFYSYLQSIIEQVKRLPGFIIPDDFKPILQRVVTAATTFLSRIDQERVNVPDKKNQNFGNPFGGLMSGSLLGEIYNLIDSTELTQIPPQVRKVVPNLNTLLTTKLGEVLEAFGVAGEDWAIYLYGLRDKTISEVVLGAGLSFDTDRYKALAEGQKYLFNTRALERLLKPLANNEVKIEFNNEIPDELKSLFTQDQTNLVVATLVTLAYRNQIKSVTVDGTTTQNSFASFILGIQVDSDGDYTYRPQSFFYGLEQLYGHQNQEEPWPLLLSSKVTLKKIVNELSSLINWMREYSIPRYVEDFFTPYFVKGWKTRYLASEGVDQPDVPAFIEYELTYREHPKQPLLKYIVRLERNSWTPDDKSQPWFNYGTWKLNSINNIT